jgi:type I restriction enzyme, S subunit
MSINPPAEWPEVRLGDHATVKARLGWKGLKAEEYVLDGPIFLAAPNLRRGRIDFDNVDHLTQWRYDESPEIQLALGDVLLVKDGSTLGISSIVRALPAPTTVNGSIAVIRPRASLSSGFLFYSINGQHFQRLVWLKRSGLGVPHLFQADLREFKLPLPAFPEQTLISKILTTTDEAIERTEALIAKYQQIKAGLMHDLFTRGVTPDGRLRPPRSEAPSIYKESPLGPIPNEWMAELLDTLAERGSGHTPAKGRSDFWNGGIKWVSLADSWRLDNVYISETDYQISQMGIDNSSAVLHPPGIVLLSRDAGVGKSAITTSPMAVSQHFMCWRCGPRINKHYLYYWLQAHKRDFENIATGSTIPTIGLRFFKFYRVAAPLDVGEQERIGSILLSADETIFAHQTSLQNLCNQKQGLMHDLLTGRVRVKIEELTAA